MTRQARQARVYVGAGLHESTAIRAALRRAPGRWLVVAYDARRGVVRLLA